MATYRGERQPSLGHIGFGEAGHAEDLRELRAGALGLGPAGGQHHAQVPAGVDVVSVPVCACRHHRASATANQPEATAIREYSWLRP